MLPRKDGNRRGHRIRVRVDHRDVVVASAHNIDAVCRGDGNALRKGSDGDIRGYGPGLRVDHGDRAALVVRNIGIAGGKGYADGAAQA